MDQVMEKRFREMADRSWSRDIPCYTDFLDLSEQALLRKLQPGLAQPEILLFGGTEGCERVMAGFGAAGTEAFPIACLRVSPLGLKFAPDMAHRDLLGALMSLGFERSLLGDLILREKEAWLFCADRIADFICDGLSSVRHTPVQARRVDAPPAGELFRTRQETVQVTSPRLDALVAHVFRLSRGEAQSLFPAGKVFLNGAECLRPDAEPLPGQIVSVRGLGRFRYLGTESQSRKGKWNAALARYV